jgi:drug/metabolite transporter (DMT)-like permease
MVVDNEQLTVRSSSRTKAILQALFVTFLWSTSWVLIKIGLRASLSAIAFAGLRYFAAFLCLLPFVLFNSSHRDTIRNFSRGMWIQLALLGCMFYALTQGAQFISLSYMPAATLTLMLNFAPIIVALLAPFLGNESPSKAQWGGILVSAVGAMIYFLPLDLPVGQFRGMLVAFVSVLANVGSSLMGREINRKSGLPPILVTTISMGIGGFLLLIVGAATQGFGRIDLLQLLIILWLAVVNTAIAFTLWNQTLRILTAVESSIINNMMLPQISILAWLFLGEPLNLRQLIGIVLVGTGTLIVQVWRHQSITMAAAPEKSG